MPFASWTVGITIVAVSNFSKVSSQIAQQSAAAQKSVGGLTKQMSGLAAVGKIVDKAMIGVGVGAVAMLAMGIKGAADLQSATVQAAIAMGKTGNTVDATTAKMRDFRDVALQMANITGQSLPDAMGVIATMASGGITGKQIKADWKPIAQFTDVLHFGKDKMDYGEAAKLGTGLTHEMRLFSASDLRFGLGEVARLGYLSPHGTQELATQVRQAAPTLENLLPGSARSKATQIVDLTAWADRMGGLQRFGSGISQLVTNIVSPRSGRVRGALHELGVADKKGHLDREYYDHRTGTLNLMKVLNEVALHYREAINKPGGRGADVTALMGLNANASRYFQLFTSKESLQAFSLVRAQQASMGKDPAAWLDKTQQLVMGELSSQTGLLTARFHTLTTLIADGLVPPLTRVVSFLAEAVGSANTYLSNHPRTAMGIGGAMAAAATYAGVRIAQLGGNALHTFAVLGKHPHFGVGASHLLGHGAEGAARIGTFGGIGEAVGGLFGFAAIRSEIGKLVQSVPFLTRAFSGLTPIMGRLTGFSSGLRTVLMIVGADVARFGLRFIPLVGEILLAIDAIRFLGAHMKDIGFVAGQVAGWIIKNFPGIIRGAAGLAMAAMKDLISSIISVIDPRNWAHAVGEFAHGIAAGYQAATAPATPARAPVTIHVHVAAGKDARHTGAIVGAAVAHHIARAGDHVNAALGPGLSGSPVPARH